MRHMKAYLAAVCGAALLLNGCSGTQASSAPDTAVQSAADTAALPDASGEEMIDLTVMNSTMVYAQVYDIMYKPDDYIGREMKIHGPFSVFHDDSTGKYYFAVLIEDATACCSQGMEFVWDGQHSYPADYPEEGTDITVTGIFETYEEDGSTYCQLTGATMEITAA